MKTTTAQEACRVFRKVEVTFADGQGSWGSGYAAFEPGRVVTCAHVVRRIEDGSLARRIQVFDIDGRSFDAQIHEIDDEIDLATLETSDEERPGELWNGGLPALGEDIVYAGQPMGTRRAGVFSGMVSLTGSDLLKRPACDLIQINGMINFGNSGGPVFIAGGTQIVGTITAKYVPLLEQIEGLRDSLRRIPQFPTNVVIDTVDFAKFVNVTVSSLHKLSAVLRLVQVGTGWAIPSRYLKERNLL